MINVNAIAPQHPKNELTKAQRASKKQRFAIALPTSHTAISFCDIL
ncbi:hypothetical protein VB711_13090 [Cronbergia sp. UHCC 0137]|nr:hypothetical protein [Cronbergia sp. UHCC 0137]MEA5618766.1 hypothetical protein [Cronbergia sp. UHCC 0137]